MVDPTPAVFNVVPHRAVLTAMVLGRSSPGHLFILAATPLDFYNPKETRRSNAGGNY